MSKKKPTAPIPLTGTVTITTDGRTTLGDGRRPIGARTSRSAPACPTAAPATPTASTRGARIALARLYGLDPFPKVENEPQEKGHWEKANPENCKKGSRVRVVAAEFAEDAYQNGDQGIIQDAPLSGGALRHIIFDGRKGGTSPGCFLRELEVWVPTLRRKPSPRRLPSPKLRSRSLPASRWGISSGCQRRRTFFIPVGRGKVGKVIRASETPAYPGAMYFLAVNLNPGETRHQYCTEWPDDPAPLELLFRDPQKGGEEA